MTESRNESRDNKKELIRCALHLFANKGYDGTATAEIVEAAGVTKPTMYHYFGNKEGLLKAVLSEYYSPFLKELADATTLSRDIALTFFRLAQVYFSYAEKFEDFIKFRESMMLRTGEDSAYLATEPYITKESSVIRAYFDSAAQQAGNIKGKELMCTITFVGTINAAVSAYLHTKDKTFLSDETIYRLRQQFLYGIYS
ncbi:MAG: TetR/AcrR family transcriptional regulator [Ruminococcus sp.]